MTSPPPGVAAARNWASNLAYGAARVAADPELTHLPALRTALDALLDEEREQYLEKG